MKKLFLLPAFLFILTAAFEIQCASCGEYCGCRAWARTGYCSCCAECC